MPALQVVRVTPVAGRRNRGHIAVFHTLPAGSAPAHCEFSMSVGNTTATSPQGTGDCRVIGKQVDPLVAHPGTAGVLVAVIDLPVQAALDRSIGTLRADNHSVPGGFRSNLLCVGCVDPCNVKYQCSGSRFRGE
jgi:hypothetical protein